jgi:hypothetical protein
LAGASGYVRPTTSCAPLTGLRPLPTKWLRILHQSSSQAHFTVDWEQAEQRKRELKEQFPGWHIWFVPHSASDGETWCAQPWPLINAGSADELTAAMRAAHQGPPFGSPSLASWRSYRARTRARREYAAAEAERWQRLKAQPRRRRTPQAPQADPGDVA